MFPAERRSERRYPVRQPARVKLKVGNVREIDVVARDVSTHGALLQCESPIPLRSKIEVTLRFPNALPLQAPGEVLRVEQPSPGGAFLIAIRCDAPWEFLR